MSVITAVTSARGGAGKTMFASNLACTLAKRGEKVLVIDMNPGYRNQDICFGLESQLIFDLGDVLSGVCTIKKALIEDSRFECLSLLSASQNADKAVIKPAHMKKLCKQLSRKYEYIIIDTPQTGTTDWDAAVAPADRAVIMLTDEYVSARNSEAVDSRLKSFGIEKRFAVLNRVSAAYTVSGAVPSFEEISSSVRIPLTGIIQEDENIHIAMNSGIPVVCAADTYISRVFDKIAEKIFE